jgi:hypothetical protein
MMAVPDWLPDWWIGHGLAPAAGARQPGGLIFSLDGERRYLPLTTAITSVSINWQGSDSRTTSTSVLGGDCHRFQ